MAGAFLGCHTIIPGLQVERHEEKAPPLFVCACAFFLMHVWEYFYSAGRWQSALARSLVRQADFPSLKWSDFTKAVGARPTVRST